jgi:hypothetical protein
VLAADSDRVQRRIVSRIVGETDYAGYERRLDARVSGTAGSAELAAREAPVPVTVVDTQTVTFGVGLCVRAAAAVIAAGASAAEAAAAARRVAATLRDVFVAHRSPPGRLPDATERYRVRPAVGAHTGALSFGAFWWPASAERGSRPHGDAANL